MYRLIIKNNKKHDKIGLLEKVKSNTIDVLISKPLTDLFISHDEIVPGNYKSIMMKKDIKNSETSVEYTI